MNKIKIQLVFFVSLLVQFANAQQDSLEIDTVLVIKEPVIVKKQVIVAPLSVEQPQTPNLWGLEPFWVYGKTVNISNSDTVQFSSISSFNAGFLVTRKLGHWEVGIGLSFSENSFKYQKNKTEYNNFTKDSSYVKVLTQYNQFYNGGDTVTYITQTRDTTLYEHQAKIISSSGINSYSYLQIPVSIGYVFNLWKNKLFLLPRIQFITGIRIRYGDNGFESPQPIVLGYTAQLNFMYELTKRWNILLKANWQSNISSVYNMEYLSQKWQSIGLGFGIGMNF